MYSEYENQLKKLNIRSSGVVNAYHYPDPLSGTSRKYPVFEIKPELFNDVIDVNFGNFTKWRRRLTRGFAIGDLIIIKAGVRLGKTRLILHEIGHLQGRSHTKLPGLMHPSWLMRWSSK